MITQTSNFAVDCQTLWGPSLCSTDDTESGTYSLRDWKFWMSMCCLAHVPTNWVHLVSSYSSSNNKCFSLDTSTLSTMYWVFFTYLLILSSISLSSSLALIRPTAWRPKFSVDMTRSTGFLYELPGGVRASTSTSISYLCHMYIIVSITERKLHLLKKNKHKGTSMT